MSAPAQLILDEVDSTNAEAIRQFDGSPLWVLARRQTAGKGRRGRNWHSADGNFFASLILNPDCPADVAARHSFVAALALYDALVDVRGSAAGLTLKWPNDVLLFGSKIAGILLEASGPSPQVERLVIGIGVNLVKSPATDEVEEDATRPASVFPDMSSAPSPEDFMSVLAPAMDRWLNQIASEGFVPIRDAWLGSAAKLGEPVIARLLREQVEGIFETIDDTGALVLQTPTGQRVLPTADVFFP